MLQLKACLARARHDNSLVAVAKDGCEVVVDARGCNFSTPGVFRLFFRVPQAANGESICMRPSCIMRGQRARHLLICVSFRDCPGRATVASSSRRSSGVALMMMMTLMMMMMMTRVSSLSFARVAEKH